jgi:hypothetical protein
MEALTRALSRHFPSRNGSTGDTRPQARFEVPSGSIAVNIEVKSGDKPAVMRLATKSGSISIKMVRSSWFPWVPNNQPITNRTLDISVSTTSGSVGGSVLAGNGGKTEISTTSGSHGVNIYLVGVGKDDNTTRLSTISSSGSQTIRVISQSEDDVLALEARHVVKGSGSMVIKYPTQWNGKLHAFTDGSGHVAVTGNDLEQSGGGKDVYAWRGEGDLKEVDVHVRGSGSIGFAC